MIKATKGAIHEYYKQSILKIYVARRSQRRFQMFHPPHEYSALLSDGRYIVGESIFADPIAKNDYIIG